MPNPLQKILQRPASCQLGGPRKGKTGIQRSWDTFPPLLSSSYSPRLGDCVTYGRGALFNPAGPAVLSAGYKLLDTAW
eukprot:gene6347-1351_t